MLIKKNIPYSISDVINKTNLGDKDTVMFYDYIDKLVTWQNGIDLKVLDKKVIPFQKDSAHLNPKIDVDFGSNKSFYPLRFKNKTNKQVVLILYGLWGLDYILLKPNETKGHHRYVAKIAVYKGEKPVLVKVKDSFHNELEFFAFDKVSKEEKSLLQTSSLRQFDFYKGVNYVMEVTNKGIQIKFASNNSVFGN